jgi:hypothetical protein
VLAGADAAATFFSGAPARFADAFFGAALRD